MPNWLVNTLIVVLLSCIFLTLLAVACFKFSYRIKVKDDVIRQLEKENKHKQELLDAYGIKEITIKKENYERDEFGKYH